MLLIIVLGSCEPGQESVLVSICSARISVHLDLDTRCRVRLVKVDRPA
jgi:hypothetical protein